MSESKGSPVVRRLGDLRFSAPRVLEELSGDVVVRSFDLGEWSAGVATGRRWGCGFSSLALAAGLLLVVPGIGWPRLVAIVPAVVLAVVSAVLLRRKLWLVLWRGDEQVVLHAWDGGEGEEALVAFLGLVLGAARSGDDGRAA